MKQLLILMLLTHVQPFSDVSAPRQTITKNGMVVNWEYEDDRIHFEVEAPSSGWLCIGFNEGTGMTGAYLLMGRIVDGKAEVVEHYTKSPGNYNPLTDYGIASVVHDVSGVETADGSHMRFSLPIIAISAYARNLHSGTTYTVTLAYSRSDDFDHHSMMRTSVIQKL